MIDVRLFQVGSASIPVEGEEAVVVMVSQTETGLDVMIAQDAERIRFPLDRLGDIVGSITMLAQEMGWRADA